MTDQPTEKRTRRTPKIDGRLLTALRNVVPNVEVRATIPADIDYLVRDAAKARGLSRRSYIALAVRAVALYDTNTKPSEVSPTLAQDEKGNVHFDGEETGPWLITRMR
jgi:hypothetical protein